MKRIINTDAAPKAVGPYSQAIEINGTLYISGQLPVDPSTGAFVNGGIKEQTRQALENIFGILAAAGYSPADVVKSTVLLADIGDFAAMNEVYSEFYRTDMPARVAYQVAALPMGALVEIETIAAK
ncbi:MAG: RidA family protein [Prevotellaceae bacterium]|nr:RidA family protein [Prevotellaceae bacterium]